MLWKLSLSLQNDKQFPFNIFRLKNYWFWIIEYIARTLSAKSYWKNKVSETVFMSQLVVFNIVIFHTLRNLLSNNTENLSIKTSDYQW